MLSPELLQRVQAFSHVTLFSKWDVVTLHLKSNTSKLDKLRLVYNRKVVKERSTIWTDVDPDFEALMEQLRTIAQVAGVLAPIPIVIPKIAAPLVDNPVSILQSKIKEVRF